MKRGFLLLAATLASAACAPKGTSGPGSGGDAAYMMITKEPTGIPLVIVNRTKRPIVRLSLSGFPANSNVSPHDEYKTNIAPDGGRVEIVIDPKTMNANELSLSAHSPKSSTAPEWDTDIVLMNDKNIVLDGPTELDIVESEQIAEPVKSGYKRIVRLTYQRQKERAAATAQAFNEKQQKQCQAHVEGAHGTPKPGKTKAQGKFKCVFGGAFNGTSNAQVVQLADGKITATVTEVGNGNVANITWEGIVDGDEMKFAYSGLPSGGALKIDPGGRALIGQGTSLLDTGCVQWTLTCTR